MRISDWSSDVCSSDLPDGQCTASGAKPASSTSACTNFSGCSFDWVKPPEVVTVIPVGSNPPGRPGCGQVQRAFDPSCRRNDGTAMADRKSVVSGTGVSVRLDPGGRRIITKKKI